MGIGWITAKTDLDQHLIKELNKESVTRLSKNLDSYVARQVSRSQVTRVLTSGALGSSADRSMGKSRSSDSSDGRRGGQPRDKSLPAPVKAKAPPPKLSKLACCC